MKNIGLWRSLFESIDPQYKINHVDSKRLGVEVDGESIIVEMNEDDHHLQLYMGDETPTPHDIVVDKKQICEINNNRYPSIRKQIGNMLRERKLQ